jgi:phosphoglycerate dehydrogenase-like enzyme
MRVWVPYEAMREDLAASAGQLQVDLRVDLYDGGTVPPAIDEVEFYVIPYMSGPHTSELMASMPRLRVAQTLTAGYEDVLPRVPSGVRLCNARGVHDASTAELAVGLIIASLRGFPAFFHAQLDGAWAHERRASVADRSVLVLGYGSVGQAIERRLTALEASVVRVARTARPDEGVSGMEDTTALLADADVVVLALPLTPGTRGLVDAGFLAAMKDGALLVNVARGAIVRTDALLREVETGRLTAALDVTDPEPLPPDHPLWRCPGAIITPHVGGDSTAFLPRARRLVRDQVERYADRRDLHNVVA